MIQIQLEAILANDDSKLQYRVCNFCYTENGKSRMMHKGAFGHTGSGRETV